MSRGSVEPGEVPSPRDGTFTMVEVDQQRILLVGQLREIRPELPVEQVVAQDLQGFGGRVHLDRLLGQHRRGGRVSAGYHIYEVSKRGLESVRRVAL